jgi:hypothetical protein
MEVARHGAEFSARAHLDAWCRDEFGPTAAPAMAAYYRAYFAAPGRWGDAGHDTLADTAYHNFLRFILVSLIKGRPELSTAFVRIPEWDPWLARVGGAAREAEPRWKDARRLAEQAAPLIPPGRRQFFQAHVMTQLDIQEHSNHALALAVHAWSHRDVAVEDLARVIAELESVLAAFKSAEYGKWRGFYAEDRFTNVRQSLELARAAKLKLTGRPIPPGIRVEALTIDPYGWIKRYQKDRRADVRE